MNYLRAVHQRALVEGRAPSITDERRNTAMAVAFAIAGVVAVTAGGYHFGFESIHMLGARLPPAVLEILADGGDTLLLICVMALFLQRDPRLLWTTLLAGVYAAILTHGLKTLFNEPRPPVVFGNLLTVVGPVLKWSSFPSGHAVTAFLAASCLSVKAPRVAQFLFFALAVGFGLGRVGAGVHWPVDVIAGAAVATASFALATCTVTRTTWTSWGLRFEAQTFFAIVFALCFVVGFVRVPRYPLAQPVFMTIAVLSLLLLIWNYILRPLRTLCAPAEIPRVSVGNRMRLDDQIINQSAGLFRWRNLLPLALLPALLFAMKDGEYVQIRFGETIDTVWESLSMAIAFMGLALRAYTLGYVPSGSLGHIDREQSADWPNFTGMYSVVRHPIQLANFVMSFGVMMFVESMSMLLVGTLAYWLYYERTMLAEEEFLARTFGAKYAEWATATPFLIPKPALWKPPELSFSLRAVLAREHGTAYVLVVIFTAIDLLHAFLQAEPTLIDQEWLAFLSIGTVLYAVLRILTKCTTILQVDAR